MEPLSYEMGLALVKEIGALGYRECSALNRMGLKEVFDTGIRAAIGADCGGGVARSRPKRTCVVL